MLGEALRLVRVFHDCKLGELAEAIGMSPSYISEIEKGKKTPSLSTLNKYAEFFDTSVSALLFFSEELDKEDRGLLRKSVHVAMRKRLIRFLQIVEDATV